MTVKTRVPFAFLILALVFPGVSCKNGMDEENMKIPRLMVETRGADAPGSRQVELTLPISGTSIMVRNEPVIHEFQITDIELVKVDMGKALLIKVSDLGARALYRQTVANMGKRMVLTVNGTPVGARRIEAPIKNGIYYTFVEVPDSELDDLVIDLKKTLEELQSRQ
ncbi:MAG: hypothetical protein ACLFS4_05965 [Opitutales bacterium]